MNPLSTFISARIAAFEREWDYDASYLRAISSAGVNAVRAVAGLDRVAKYRKGIPLAPWFAAKIVATRSEDCGPCVQLIVRMAERAGVDARTLRAILAKDEAAMSDDVRLVVRFTHASLAHAPHADELREAIVALWGDDAVVSLAFAILSGRAYPTLKYALGYGKACVRVTVAGVETPVPQLAPA